MIVVNTHQAKTQLSALLRQIELHHEVIRLCRNGKPIADLVPIKKAIDPLKNHLSLSKGAVILYDPTSPLTEEEWPSGQSA